MFILTGDHRNFASMSQLYASKSKKVRIITSFGLDTLRQSGKVVSSFNVLNSTTSSDKNNDEVIDLGKFKIDFQLECNFNVSF